MNFLDENGDIRSTHETFTKAPLCGIISFEKPRTPDYFWKKINILEEYDDVGALLRVGETRFVIPFKWAVMIMDLDLGVLTEMEHVVGLSKYAFGFNPLQSYLPTRLPVIVENIFDSYRFITPKLEKTHLLVVPLHNTYGTKKENLCIIVGEHKPKLIREIDLASLW